jgi:hypothetical protein
MEGANFREHPADEDLRSRRQIAAQELADIVRGEAADVVLELRQRVAREVEIERLLLVFEFLIVLPFGNVRRPGPVP